MLVRLFQFAAAFALVACIACARPDPDDWRVAWNRHIAKGTKAHARGDDAKAEKEFLAALAEAQYEVPAGIGTAVALNNLATLYIDQGHLDRAEAPMSRAILLFEEAGETSNEHFAAMLTNAGELSVKAGRSREAEGYFRRSLALSDVVPDPDSHLRWRSLRGLAESLAQQGRTSEARSYAEQALRLRPE